MKQISPRSADRPAKDTAKAAILQAALEEFGIRGCDSATTRGISARAGVTHGLVRYYFGSKEQLWYAAADFLFERIAREMTIAPDQAIRMANGDRIACRDWLRSYVRYCARHPEDARIIYQETAAKSERLQRVADRHIRQVQQQYLVQLARLIEVGIFPKTVTPISLLYVITASAQNFFALAEEVRLASDIDVSTPEAIEAHANTVVDLLIPLLPGDVNVHQTSQ